MKSLKLRLLLLLAFWQLSPLVMQSQDQGDIVFIQASESENRSELVIDVNHKNGEYPSLEEEMSIYLEFKKDIPQAFFFPSPSNGIVWIEHNLGDQVTLSLFDVAGERLYTAHDMNVKKLDLSHFKAGRYDLVLKGHRGTVKRYVNVR